MMITMIMMIIQEHGGNAAEAKAAGVGSASAEGEQ